MRRTGFSLLELLVVLTILLAVAGMVAPRSADVVERFRATCAAYAEQINAALDWTEETQ